MGRRVRVWYKSGSSKEGCVVCEAAHLLHNKPHMMKDQTHL